MSNLPLRTGYEGASYIVYKKDGHIYAKNGDTGDIEFGGANDLGGIDGTDASSVIQAAIDGLPSGGGKVVLGQGDFTLSTGISTATNYVHLEGFGISTRIVGPGSVDLVTLTGSRSIVSNIRFKHTSTGDGYAVKIGSSNIKVINCVFNLVAGDGIVVDGGNCIISRCFMYNGRNNGNAIKATSSQHDLLINSCIIQVDWDYGLYQAGGEETMIVNSEFSATNNDGIYIKAGNKASIVNCRMENNSGDGIVIESSFCTVSACTIENVTTAIKVTNPDVRIGNCSILNCDYGIELAHGWHSAVNNKIRGCTNWGIGLTQSNYRGTEVVGNQVEESGTVGLYIKGEDLTITGNCISQSTQHGIHVVDTDRCVIVANSVMQNDFGNTGTYNGIELENVDGCVVAANEIWDSDNYGVHIDSDCSEVRIQSCRFADNTAGPIHDEASDTIIKDNTGYATEASGTATITNGTTSVTVTHGLDVTPSAGDIAVHPIETLGSASFFWVDTITATQFDINVDADPTQDVDFAWNHAIH